MSKHICCKSIHLLFVELILLLLLLRKSSCQFADVENCATVHENAIKYYSHHSIYLVPKQLPNPEGYKISDYSWSYEAVFRNSKETPPDVKKYVRNLYDSVYELFVPGYTFTPTDYIIKVYARRLNSRPGPMYAFNENGKNYKECHLRFLSYLPVGVITGGFGKTVPSNRDTIVNGDESYDANFIPRSNENLKYMWTCTQKKTTVNFCKKDPVSTSARFTIPANMVKDGDEFEISLTVSKASYRRTNIPKKQTIFVVANAAHLEVHCRKNCPPATLSSSNNKATTVVVVKCVENCDGIQEQDYRWTIREESMNELANFDYNKHSRFGQNGSSFVLEKNALPANIYHIRVDLQSRNKGQSYAYQTIFFSKGANVTECSTQPTEGNSLETEFKLTCEQFPKADSNFYELYVKDSNDITTERLIIDGYYPLVQEKLFKLPPSIGKIFIVKVVYRDRHEYPVNEVELKTNVVSTLSNKTQQEIVQIVDDLYHGESSVAEMVANKDPSEREKALQVFQTAIDELVVSKIEDQELIDFIEDLKYTAAEDMLNAPVDAMKEIVSLSYTLTSLANHNVSKEKNPLLAKYVTTICKKMADRSLEFMKNHASPLELTDKAKQMAGIMSKCALPVHSNADFELLSPIKVNFTTEKPVLDYPLLTENYPNYEDHDEDYYKNMDALKEATFNVVNVSSTVAKVMAMTTAAGEGLFESVGKTSSTVVAKDSGAELLKNKIRCEGVTLLPSHDFENDEHFYDILVTIWKNDIFWWNPSHTRVATDIINCEFWHSTCKERIKNFQKPFTLNFEMKVNDTSDVVGHSLTVPKGFSSMSTDEMNDQIRVHRVILPRGIILFIDFYDVTSTFVVVLTINKFPTMEDFTKNATSITGDKQLRLLHDDNYDGLAYIGILADKDTGVEQTTVTYGVSFTTKYCLRWIMVDNMWEPSCKAGLGSNETIIQCLCDHASVIAGYVENIKSDVQVLTKPDIELELLTTPVIFATVVTTFCLFFILLLLVLIERKKGVYFLGDNVARDRFAYLLLIKTRSGTSSNIVVKLKGEKKSSEPHVLNYPDPKLRFLQRLGNDMFLLTTQNHLGNLKKIELWFDCIGPSPAWYCKEITVYDLQLWNEWHFDIKKRLSVIKGTAHIVADNPTFVPNQTSSRERKTETRLRLSSLNDRFKLLFDCKAKVTPEQGKSLPKRHKLRWSYHTWFLWQKEEDISYVKKLTVITSTVLVTYTMALLYHGIPSLELKDGLDKHFYKIDTYSIFVASASSFPTFLFHTFIAWGFRFSRDEQNEDKWLPFYCSVACWALLVTLITISTTLLITFGFWVPYNSSWMWLTSCLMGISFEIFVYETIFLFILNYGFKPEMKFNLWKHFHAIWRSAEIQRKHLYAQFGEQLLRPYFEHLYKPLKRRQIKAKLLTLRQRYSIISELEDLFMFGVYVVILYVVILANKDSLVVQGKTTMMEIIKGVHTRTLGFHKIENALDMYEFINITLIPSIHPSRWYGLYTASEPALMTDMVNKYIGVARMRQHRNKRYLCNVAKVMSFLNMSCYPEFSISYTESRAFGYFWGEFSHHVLFDRLKNVWQYSTQYKSETLGTVGEFSSYTGGGYIAFLGRTLYNSYLNFRKLLEKLWIDHETRAVFIEFLTYNANYNIFTSVRLIFEQSATGFAYKTIKVFTVRMLLVQNEVEAISSVFFFLFAFWVAMLFFKESIGAIRRFRDFYRDLWLLTDFFITLMSITCIILFIARMTLIGRYLSAMEEAKNNEFLSYFYLFYIEDILTLTAAVLVCVATVRLWKFLRFGLIFRVFEKTLLKAAPTLLAFALLFLILVVAFGMALLMIIGNHFEKIYSFMKLVRLIMTMAFKSEEMELGKYTSYYVAIFFLTLCGLTALISTFIFIMIIVKFYGEAQMEFSSETDSYTIKHYVQERFKYFKKLTRYKYFRLRAGKTYSLKVEPKNDKFLYLDSLSVPTSKMQTMKYITQSVLRNSKQFIKPSVLSDFDAKLMLRICEHFLKKDDVQEVNVFYKGRIKGKRIRFVDETSIEKIANVVNLLLQDELPTFEHVVSDPVLEECARKIATNQNTLKRCVLRLKLMLNQMKNIKLDFPKKLGGIH